MMIFYNNYIDHNDISQDKEIPILINENRLNVNKTDKSVIRYINTVNL